MMLLAVPIWPGQPDTAEPGGTAAAPTALPYGPASWHAGQWAVAALYVLAALVLAILVARLARPHRAAELSEDATSPPREPSSADRPSTGA